MTKEQYNDFVQYLETQITRVEMTIANIEDQLGCLERMLEIHRNRNEWGSYGTTLDRMQSRLREREYWTGHLKDCEKTLAEAKRYGIKTE